MGKLLNGPQGQVIGSVGNTVSYVVGGQNVIRAKAKKKKKLNKYSRAQKANLHKMTVINAFFESILPILKVGFQNEAFGTRHNYHNLATSYNKKHALKGEYPNMEIDYPKAKISSGPLAMPLISSVALVPEGVEFNWTYSHYQPGAKAGDQTVVLLFFPDLQQSLLFIYGHLRSSEKETILLPEEYLSLRIEPYLFFTSGDRTLVSDSIYLGRIN